MVGGFLILVALAHKSFFHRASFVSESHLSSFSSFFLCLVANNSIVCTLHLVLPASIRVRFRVRVKVRVRVRVYA